MNIRDMIRSADDGGDPGTIAEIVLRKVFDDFGPADQEQLLLPLVRSEVVRLQRHRSKRKEDRAFAEAATELGAMRSLRDEPFMDPESKAMTTWSRATAAQHCARALWLENNQIRPTQQTVRRHRTAARIITERGVGCLAELSEFGEAA